MTNIQQPEMRRNGKNPTVQDSKGPGPEDRPDTRGGGGAGRPVPRGQVSPYGPSGRSVADDGRDDH